MRFVARRSAVVVTTVVAVALLGACKAPAFPGGPADPGPTTSLTDAPTEEPTGEPTTGPTEEPTADPTAAPGGSDGVDVSVTIEPGYSMPNLVEASLKQARRALDHEGARTLTVVDARRGGEITGQSNGWTVCSQEPAPGDFARESVPVVLAAAPNARQCP